MTLLYYYKDKKLIRVGWIDSIGQIDAVYVIDGVSYKIVEVEDVNSARVEIM